MPMPEEIERRVAENDAARSARRAAAATRVADLAQRRAAVAEQLGEIERELGDVLADAQDVIDVEELARFTDLAPADLTQWLTVRAARKPSRAKRKRPTTGVPITRHDTSARPRTASTAPADQSTTPVQSSGSRDGTAPARVPAHVG